jgi:hypothetical protein
MSEQVDQVEFLVPLGPMRSLGIVDLPPDRTGASWAVATADLAGTNLAARAGLQTLESLSGKAIVYEVTARSLAAENAATVRQMNMMLRYTFSPGVGQVAPGRQAEVLARKAADWASYQARLTAAEKAHAAQLAAAAASEAGRSGALMRAANMGLRFLVWVSMPLLFVSLATHSKPAY